MLRPHKRDPDAHKAQILRAYRERMSLRRLQRVFGIWRTTVLRGLEQDVAELPMLPQPLRVSTPCARGSQIILEAPHLCHSAEGSKPLVEIYPRDGAGWDAEGCSVAA